jgi:hydroxymethylbilane synthase
MSGTRVVRVGTRGSALAIAQTVLVIDALHTVAPDMQFEQIIIRTEGDRDKVTPLTVIGGQGVFTAALQSALLNGDVDCAVHSAKDLPPVTPDGLMLAAFPERADPCDVFISRHGVSLDALPAGARVGTSSRRRMVQARAINPNIELVELRGNLDTRLRKSAEPEYDGIIVAAAGLDRMGWQDRITGYLPVDRFVPSPGQGALAVECRAADTELAALIARIDHAPTRIAVTAERAFLAAARAGCVAPMAAYGERDGEALRLHGMVADADLTNARWTTLTAAATDPEAAGCALADALDVAEVRMNERTMPLAGLGVLVTRPEGQADEIARKLEAQGATVLHAPTIAITDPPSYVALDAALRHLPSYDWVIWTSANGVTRTLVRMRTLGIATEKLRQCSLAVIGGATARALAAAGFTADLMPPQAVAESLRDALLVAGVGGGTRILLPQPVVSRDVLAMGLRAAGAVVDVVPAYATVPNSEGGANVRRWLAEGRIDIALATSPSTVTSLLGLLDDDLETLRRSPLACIGPGTAEAVRMLGLVPAIVATDHTTDGLVAALIDSRIGARR